MKPAIAGSCPFRARGSPPMPAAASSRTVRSMKHSMKMMWGCVALLALAVGLAVAGANVGYLVFALPCMLMMGAMVWMMMRAGRGGDQR